MLELVVRGIQVGVLMDDEPDGVVDLADVQIERPVDDIGP